MDDDFDYGRFKFLAFCLVIFAGLLIFCLFDLLFSVFGHEATATVTSVGTQVTMSRRSRNDLFVDYKFTDSDGEERTGTTNIGSSPKVLLATGDEITVQYLPGWMLSKRDVSSVRMSKSFSWIKLGLLVIATLIVIKYSYSAIYSGETSKKVARKR